MTSTRLQLSCSQRVLRGLATFLPLLLLILIGCSSSSDNGKNADGNAEFKLGDLIEPFDPPPLDELLSAHEWEDRPVVDDLNRMREYQAQLGAPKLTDAEALALHNDSREKNELILDALGRLAPADGAGVDFDAELTLIADGSLNSTVPLLSQTVVDSDYNILTAFGLFGFDCKLEKFAIKNNVVSWRTSEDRTVDIVEMRDDLTWSDGEPITAHDVAYSFQVLMTEDVPVPAMRQGTDQIRWIEAYDDQTLAYFHKEGLSTNEGNMNFYVVPKHVFEKTIAEDPTLSRSDAHRDFAENPVVGGPYKLVKWVRGQEFVLERRQDYCMHHGEQVREEPYFKTVRFKVIEDRNTGLLALRSGDVDAMMLLADQWISQQTNDDEYYRANTKASGVEWTSFHFCWNMQTPYFSDKRVRHAMSWAMDYQELLDTICYGVYDRCHGAFHPDSKMFPKDPPELFHQDLDRAEDLLDEAGWVDSDGDGIRDKEINGKVVPFEFTLLVLNREDRVKIATLLKECVEQIGVVCHVKPSEFTVLTQTMMDRKFHAAFAGWSTGADPDTNTNLWYTGEQRNYPGYSNARVDELFELARHEFDAEKRNAMYGEIHSILWEDQPYTWLFTQNSFYGFNKKLRGYNYSPRGPFHYDPGMSSMYAPADAP